MSRTHRWLIAAGLLVLLAALALAIEIFLPYRPTQAEAIDKVVTIFGHETNIIHIVDRVPRSLLLAFQVDQSNRHCLELRYITRHWLSGTRSYTAASTCQPLLPSAHPRAIRFTSRQVSGTYALFGAVADERIAAVQGMWSDGQATSVSVEEEGYFLFFREEGDLHIESVVGLDAEGRELAETKTDNR